MAGATAILEQIAVHGLHRFARPDLQMALSGCADCSHDTRYGRPSMGQLQFLTHEPQAREASPSWFHPCGLRNFLASSILAIGISYRSHKGGPDGMRVYLLILCSAFLLGGALGAAVEKDVTELQIGVKHRPKVCERKAKAGDKVDVHYTVRVSHRVDRPRQDPAPPPDRLPLCRHSVDLLVRCDRRHAKCHH